MNVLRLRRCRWRSSTLVLCIVLLIFPALNMAQEEHKPVINSRDEPAETSDPTSAVQDWRPLSEEQQVRWLESWLQRQGVESAAQRVDSLVKRWTESLVSESGETETRSLPLRWRMQTCSDQMQQWLPQMQQRRKELETLLDDLKELPPPDEMDHWLRVDLGCALAREHKYDQAKVALVGLSIHETPFPSELLFFRGLTHYKLLEFPEARDDLELLQKHAEQLEKRTASLTRLMLADLPDEEDHSLRQVARLMDDAWRRQSLGQAGQRVLDQEQKVVDLLDQLIKEKEEQQQKQQQQGQAQAQAKNAKPMDKSMRAPMLGKGEVDPRKMTAKEWGDLPPEKQAEVIAEMTRQMPPHYRKVIEEYFRQLTEKR